MDEDFKKFVEETRKEYDEFRKEANEDLKNALERINNCKEANKENPRTKANEEYLRALKDPNNWKTVEAEPPVQDTHTTDSAPVYAQEQTITAQVSTLPKEATTNSAPVYAQEQTITAQVSTLPKEATTNSTESQKVEVIGKDTYTMTDTTITAVDDKGNGYGAEINGQGRLSYYLIKDGEKSTNYTKEDIQKLFKGDDLEKMHAMAVTSMPNSKLSEAAIASGIPSDMQFNSTIGRIIVTGSLYSPEETMERSSKTVAEMKDDLEFSQLRSSNGLSNWMKKTQEGR